MLKFKENIFLKNVSVLFLGTIVSQALNIGGLPILSRLYGIEDFATLAVFMAVGLIVLSFSTLQLDLAIVQIRKLEDRLALLKIASLSVLVISTITSLGVFFLGKDWNEVESLFLFFYLMTNAGNQILVYFFNSDKKYQTIAASRIILALINLIFAISLFYWNHEIGLIAAITLANIFSFSFFLVFFRENIEKVFRIKSSYLKSVLLKNIQFLKFSTPANFLDILSYQIVVIFLAKYFSEEITGSFFMAMRVVLLPTGLIGLAISQVFYKDIADKHYNQKLTYADFWKVWKILLLIGVLPFNILYFFGEEIFSFILGAEWSLAGQMASILAISGFFIFISSPTSSGFVVMNQQKYNLLNSSIRTVYTISFLIWSSLENSIFLFLWSYTIAEFIMIVLYNIMMLQMLKIKNRT